MTAILRDVPKTFSFEEQRTEINEIAWDLYNLQLGQVVLSVSVQPEGNANLTYDSNTGVFEYTPPDLSAFLTGETAPIFSASPAAGITAQDIIKIILVGFILLLIVSRAFFDLGVTEFNLVTWLGL